mmetsp:Transcript_61849/g.109847  ORF Transcript_61849/g.109847 Transcript_61849/m.109847 type:complete len:941 (-) Transcript_61849:35-2857(-)|eukprot:CAMPEP_0197657994 /NCGR_PEP_ID=MMETSP1338-20131121/44968_1 /TAXON_ID=43686 ORGANISM="Pelagodinium beii, Strain RCC1491" /NCGR_SAMPLE_ID=MMETSP1338 /ASSEMBLY_ACC=CAM_ASM_000754 /LENGTH=940 /DNA_ID=CAMNT_0043234489 /DNA_START=157 /DNA_END=2979 /DNA_ORIENTATION=-
MIAIIQSISEVVLAAKMEISVFILAVVLHYLLFSNHSPIKTSPKKNQSRSRTIETGPASIAAGSPAALLLKALKPMLRAGAKSDAMAAEMQAVLASEKVPAGSVQRVLSTTLDGLTRGLSVELLAAVRSLLKDETPNMRLGEQLLRGYMTLRLRVPFESLLAELESQYSQEGTKLPHAIAILAVQAALGANNLETALARLPDVSSAWEPAKPFLKTREQLLQQFTRLAAERSCMPDFLEALCGSGLCLPHVFEPILLQALQQEDLQTMKEIESLARQRHVALTPASRCVLLTGRQSDKELLSFYEAELSDVDVLTTQTKAGRALAEAALRLGRDDVLVKLLKVCEDARKVGLIKSFGADGMLKEAKKIFEACPEKSACLHNAILDAAISSGDAASLDQALSDAQQVSVADVVTFNTIIKGHLQKGDLTRAKRALEDLKAAGLQANVVTFNELLDATVSLKRKADWSLISEMQSCGLKPNKVTCSILLKSLQASSPTADVDRTMALLHDIDNDMDEVLLSSVCEACIRTGRADLLYQQLRRQKGPKPVQIQGAHTYGSLIRAYGSIKDLSGVWSTWRQMKTRHVQPTSITLGCMVEALVTNDDIEAGYELLQEIASDEITKPLVNAVIYGSILKGFCHQKRFARVWDVYDEMMAQNMEFSIVTYNSLIDTCARSGEMQRVEPLLRHMTEHGVSPNVITYSTILKGHCALNRLDQAFQLLEDMKKNSDLAPDEVTYNTLLDGCARYGLYDRGMTVLNDMRAAGVPPSNFTLSVLVKLAMRAKRLTKCFELCDEVSKEFNLKLNCHVYNNLIQACTTGSNCGQNIAKAQQTLERMLNDRVRPDVRTYNLLLRAFMQLQKAEECLQLLCTLSGLRGGDPRLEPYGNLATLRGGMSAIPRDILTEVLDFILRSPSAGALQELLQQPGVQIDAKIRQSFAVKVMRK